MEKFFKRKASTPESSSTPSMPSEIDLNDLPWDPADRKKNSEYHPNQRDEIRRQYLIRGPCQPRGHNFLRKNIMAREGVFVRLGLINTSIDFVIYLHLMFHILEVTDLLSRALQKKDQDTLEAVSLRMVLNLWIWRTVIQKTEDE